MGSCFCFICPHCEKEIELTLGIGMMFSPERVFYGYPDEKEGAMLKSLVSESIYSKVKNLMDNGWKPNEDVWAYGYELYYCEKCNTLESRFNFILTKGNETYSPTFVCEKCGSPHKSLKIETDGELAGEYEKYPDIYLNKSNQYLVRCTGCGTLFKANDENISESAKWD